MLENKNVPPNMISHHCATSYFVFKFLGGSQRQNWLQSVLWPTVGSHRLKTKPKRIAGGTVVPKGSNPPKEGSLVFPNNFQHFDFRFRLLHALHIQNLSNCYRHKYDQSISRIFQSFFWRIFATRPDCGTVVAVTDHTKAVEAVTAAKIASPTFAGTRRSEQARK